MLKVEGMGSTLVAGCTYPAELEVEGLGSTLVAGCT